MSPYRDPAAMPAKFVCIVCFKTATVGEAGVCACSGSPRSPLDNPETVASLRAFAAKRIARLRARLLVAAVVASVAVSLAICLALGLSIEPPWRGLQRGVGSWFTEIAFVLVIASMILIYLRTREPPEDVQSLLAWLGVRVVDREVRS